VDWTQFTIDILEFLKNIGGSWGMGIVLLTIIVRLALLPLSISQQRSMKKMQELAPRLKQLQNKYKNDPQKLQQKMMAFYKEHKFNPLGGCLPLLLQMPVFILLYTTLISVTFLQVAGQSSFMFIHRLDGTLQSYGGPIDDGTFNVKEKDKFITGKKIKVKMPSGEIQAIIDNYRNAITYEPEKITPGEPLTLEIAFKEIKFPDETVDKNQIISAVIPVLNDATKEIEHLTFKPVSEKEELSVTVNTKHGKTKFNFDVILLLVLFGVTMYGSQKIMTSMASTAAMDPQQKAMQESMTKMMPFMIMAMFIIIPIPAGVLLYMVISNIFQVGQTVAINKYLEIEDAKNKTAIVQPLEKEDYSDQIIDIESKEVTQPDSQTLQAKQNKNLSRKARKKKKQRGKKQS
jgi:YidC/Oxa1 family membrane protein insertase